MTNNNTKQLILQLFADNVVGNITAETMRTYIESIFDDSEVIINKYKTINEFESANKDTIYEGSLIAITDTVPSEQGIYVAKFNQPSDITQLTQLSSSAVSSLGDKVSSEFIAADGQVLFQVEYTDNLIDAYRNGLKIPASKVTLNSNVGVNGTVIILTEASLKDDVIEIVAIVK